MPPVPTAFPSRTTPRWPRRGCGLHRSHVQAPSALGRDGRPHRGRPRGRAFRGDHRERDVCARMIRSSATAAANATDAPSCTASRRRTPSAYEAARRSASVSAQSIRVLGARVERSRVSRRQLRDSDRLRTDFGNRGRLPQLALADRAETHDVRDRLAGPVDVAVHIESDAYARRMQRRDMGGQQVGPEGSVSGPADPPVSGGDDHRVTSTAH